MGIFNSYVKLPEGIFWVPQTPNEQCCSQQWDSYAASQLGITIPKNPKGEVTTGGIKKNLH